MTVNFIYFVLAYHIISNLEMQIQFLIIEGICTLITQFDPEI